MTDLIVRTIEEMELLYYGPRAMDTLGMSDLTAELVTKADTPVRTTTSGVYNPIYGAWVWGQMNMEFNLFGALPKHPWNRSGWRMIIARSSRTTITNNYGGVAEGGNIPDASPPEFMQVYTNPRTVAHCFSVSEIQNELGNLGADDVTSNMEILRSYFAVEHKEAHNKALLAPLPLPDPSESGNPNYKSVALESIDRIVSSNAEAVAMGASSTDHPCDPYSPANNATGIFSRTTASEYGDSVVLSPSGTLGVPGDLTDDVILQLIRTVRHKGANPTFWLTGWDTYGKIQSIYAPEVRYGVGVTNAVMSVNGVKTDVGEHVGMKVTTLYGYPVIVSKDAPQSYTGITYSTRVQKSTISNLYLLDTSNPEGYDYPRLFIKVLKPTQYFEAGMSTGLPFAINALADKGMFRTVSQAICHRFNVQGKIRDLQ